MGKLTDNLLAIFGVTPSDKGALVAGENPESKNRSTLPNITDSTDPIGDRLEMRTSSTNVVEEKTNSINGVDDATEEKDCLECRLVGSVIPTACASYVLYTAFTNPPKHYKARQLLAYKGFALSVSTTLLLLATSRLFDLGPFAKENQEVTLTAQAKQDMKNLVDAFSSVNNITVQNDKG